MDNEIRINTINSSGSDIGGLSVINGNVGIGTISPKALLDIGKYQINSLVSVLARLPEGNSQGEGTYLGVRSLNTSPVYSNSFSIEHKFYGEINSSINFFRGGSVHGGFLTFNTNNNTEQMRIGSNGNVGIGTTNPQYKLAVKGTIGCGEVKVEVTSGWADFVFHPTYKLRTLGEVEQFIKTNNHLPEIPTAAEVKENGVSLGEMNAKLLQKVEELTLYIIEQQKQINELKEMNSSFEKKLETLVK